MSDEGEEHKAEGRSHVSAVGSKLSAARAFLPQNGLGHAAAPSAAPSSARRVIAPNRGVDPNDPRAEELIWQQVYVCQFRYIF